MNKQQYNRLLTEFHVGFLEILDKEIQVLEADQIRALIRGLLHRERSRLEEHQPKGEEG